MSKTQFVALLLGYCSSLSVEKLFRFLAKLPYQVERAKPNLRAVLLNEPKFRLHVYYCTGILFYAAYSIGLAGLFCFWSLGPWFFVASVVIDVFGYPMVLWNVSSGGEKAFSDLRFILTGAILVLIFFGPAHALFFR